jgi:hypothetical protein
VAVCVLTGVCQCRWNVNFISNCWYLSLVGWCLAVCVTVCLCIYNDINHHHNVVDKWNSGGQLRCNVLLGCLSFAIFTVFVHWYILYSFCNVFCSLCWTANYVKGLLPILVSWVWVVLDHNKLLPVIDIQWHSVTLTVKFCLIVCSAGGTDHWLLMGIWTNKYKLCPNWTLGLRVTGIFFPSDDLENDIEDHGIWWSYFPQRWPLWVFIKEIIVYPNRMIRLWVTQIAQNRDAQTDRDHHWSS